MRLWQSGQMHRTVNPTTLVYAGSNPAGRTANKNLTLRRVGFLLPELPSSSYKFIPRSEAYG